MNALRAYSSDANKSFEDRRLRDFRSRLAAGGLTGTLATPSRLIWWLWPHGAGEGWRGIIATARVEALVNASLMVPESTLPPLKHLPPTSSGGPLGRPYFCVRTEK
jgi:hypothetical protein